MPIGRPIPKSLLDPTLILPQSFEAKGGREKYIGIYVQKQGKRESGENSGDIGHILNPFAALMDKRKDSD